MVYYVCSQVRLTKKKEEDVLIMNELLKLSLWAEDIKRATGIETMIQDATEEGIRQGTIDEGERYFSLTIDGERYGSVTAYSNGTYYLFSYEADDEIQIFI